MPFDVQGYNGCKMQIENSVTRDTVQLELS